MMVHRPSRYHSAHDYRMLRPVDQTWGVALLAPPYLHGYSNGKAVHLFLPGVMPPPALATLPAPTSVHGCSPQYQLLFSLLGCKGHCAIAKRSIPWEARRIRNRQVGIWDRADLDTVLREVNFHSPCPAAQAPVEFGHVRRRGMAEMETDHAASGADWHQGKRSREHEIARLRWQISVKRVLPHSSSPLLVSSLHDRAIRVSGAISQWRCCLLIQTYIYVIQDRQRWKNSVLTPSEGYSACGRCHKSSGAKKRREID
ncbi:hypothetical protein VTK73DRAFT_3763 [Phialemonium thermophilum]|uniref:Uncharacterized protein n=1 Tax=Phialemonium thermophilum TaxID=223376 RepID=A0ABR3WX23_9PEZI